LYAANSKSGVPYQYLHYHAITVVPLLHKFVYDQL